MRKITYEELKRLPEGVSVQYNVTCYWDNPSCRIMLRKNFPNKGCYLVDPRGGVWNGSRFEIFLLEEAIEDDVLW